MIIFINGSFGAGKTTIAEKLAKELPNHLLYDPEEVGFMLRNILKPIEWSGDFQDYKPWRTLVPIVAEMLEKNFRDTLIIPMTIWNQDYFKEVTDGLKKIDKVFYHFCLTAPIEVIHQRLNDRGETPGSWPYEQTQKCIASFEADMFEEKIDTSTLTPDEIVQYIIQTIRK
jgi:chloramphenicol 3-O-phosphotransferase